MPFSKLTHFVTRRRRRAVAFDGVEFIPTEELMRRQGIAGPQGPELWKHCPWAGDDDESRAFRQAIEEHCW